MVTHSLKLGTSLVESCAQTPILRGSFTRTFKLQPKWTLIKLSSPLRRIHEGTDRRLTLSQAVLSKGD